MSIYIEKKTLYIIRHGETEFNRRNIVQGSGVDTELNINGINQAIAFYQAYASHPFDRVYTSALRRSYQSVERFIEKGIPHESLPELNEISWGDFEGKEQSMDQKAIYWEIVNQWNAGNEHVSVPNGETPHQLRTRQQRALDIILSRDHEKEVLICMHGRAMKSLLCLLMNYPASRMEEFPHHNLSLYQLEREPDGTFHLVKHNDISHLT